MTRKQPAILWMGIAIAGAWSLTALPAGIPAARAADEIHGQALAGGKPVVNAVVWLDAPNAPRGPQRQKVVLDQRNMTFVPHVLAVRVGTTVDFPNNDRVFHDVFSFRDGKQFDLGLYPVGMVRKITFDKPGLSRIFCNIHPGMGAYVMAVASPYFAVSDRRGSFTLPDVPSGTYTYHAWRAGASEMSGSLAIRPGTPLEIRWP